MAKAIMIQGTGSNVGKSMLVAGLARAALRRGLRVAPFKPQNMSNNAAVTADGGEIGRAQALQARAAGREPVVDMNPVLLKPESGRRAQIIVQGQRHGTLHARDYGLQKAQLLPKVMESFFRLSDTADLIIVEGAGSPAETNLRAGDIANMGFAEAAGVPVVLVGDIDRGGVIAQIVGTHAVLDAADRARIRAFVVNKFRGDPELFADGLQDIVRHTNWTALGSLPWFEDAWRLPAEDVMDIAPQRGGSFKIVVPRLRRIANFDDLDPLASEPGVDVELVEAGRALPGNADLILIPGSKSTISDLADFRANGWDIDLHAHVRRGGHVLGICGGYQMLGQTIADPDGIEGPPTTVEGLGMLRVSTTMSAQKRLAVTRAIDLHSREPVTGYEIHLGDTKGPDCSETWLSVDGRPHGATSPDGRILGCYLHGLFSADGFRHAFLCRLGAQDLGNRYQDGVEAALDDLARHLETHLDIEALLGLAEPI